jgi:hypothetical protein
MTPNHTGTAAVYVTVTRELINSGGTPTGRPGGFAWTNAQHRILGTYPPRRGWLQKAIGRQITPEAAKAFLTIARRQKGISKKQKRKRNAALRSLAWTLQEPTAEAEYPNPNIYGGDTPPWADIDCDTACPICHGDALGRLNCPLCSVAVAAPPDPWLELERIANDIRRIGTAISLRVAVARAAKAWRQVILPESGASREMALTAQFIRALEAAMQHEEARAS